MTFDRIVSKIVSVMRNEPLVIYFHGFGSTGETSEKVPYLRQFFEVLSPTIPVEYFEASNYLKAFLDKVLTGNSRPVVFVGTSLGGYWASVMSDLYGIPCVLINPSCRPAETLERYGLPVSIFGEYPNLVPMSKAPRIVVLASDDEVLDHKIAFNLFSPVCEVRTYDAGGHTFNEKKGAITLAIRNLLALDI